MDEVYEMIVQKNGHFYVCGDVRMAMVIILMFFGGLN
jgi:sulfite reductase alpha subunit-like flavoprotein